MILASWRALRRYAAALLAIAIGLPVASSAAAVAASNASSSAASPYAYDAPPATTTTAASARTVTLVARHAVTGGQRSSMSLIALGRAAKAADEAVLSQLAKRRLAKELGGVPRSATPVAQGGSAKTGRWWEYRDSNGKLKIVVEHSDGTLHVGIPKPQSTHSTGGPPKYYDYGNFGHVGE
jgi:hypothetical protein